MFKLQGNRDVFPLKAGFRGKMFTSASGVSYLVDSGQKYSVKQQTLLKERNMNTVILLVWVLCAIICYQQAKTKGLNEGLWALMGLLFGVFAVIGVALQKSRK